MVTRSIDLEYLMRYYPEQFLGVCARNEMQPLQGEGDCVIINTDTNNLPGRHWIAVKNVGPNTIYFDPAGWVPNKSICAYFKNLIEYTTNNIQPINSLTCGQHCIYFLYTNTHATSESMLLKFINNLLL